ncbi:NAD-glutamate dehydrogenase [Propionicicella superfundia]|uniref:NAD-glutamate dehydrogenase n=1 Tax=Propionicicella superfundia TaxID=348582 RepID=UPI0004022EA5|nr:NAD-glutamate dehydrogenase [Propionicicella superfundia]
MSVTQERRCDLLAAAAGLHADPQAEPVAALLDAYYRHVLTEDLVQRRPDDLLGTVLSHRAAAAVRGRGEVLVHVFTPSVEAHGWATGNTVVQIVTDDTPFVVDSVTAELGRAGHEIRLLVHPQLPVVRDGEGRLTAVSPDPDAVVESWVDVEIARVSDPATVASVSARLRRVLGDVRAVVDDWQPMVTRAAAVAADVGEGVLPAAVDEVARVRSLLEWMTADNFLFLGYCRYRLVGEEGDPVLEPVDDTGLGLLRSRVSGDRRRLTGRVAAKAVEPSLLVLTKANSRSTVHRSSYLDYVGIKTFDDAGRVTGEHRFLGLFTSHAYNASVTAIPFLAAKVTRARELSGFADNSHSAKDLVSVLETYPRAELFQASAEVLSEVATSVVASRHHRQTQLFLRRDDYGRFTSCLVYLPRDRYDTEVRHRIEALLLSALDGVSAEHTALVTDSPLAMVHFVVRAAPGSEPPVVEAGELEGWLRSAVRTWDSDWRDAMFAEFGEEDAARLVDRWAGAFDDAYRATYPARVAAVDVRHLEGLGGSLALNLTQPQGSAATERRLKLYSAQPIELNAVMPVLLDFGLQVTDERPHRVCPAGGDGRYILDFGIRAPAAEYWTRGGGDVREAFLDAISAVWSGLAESDRFNQLVGTIGATWSQIVCLRAVAAYLKQTTHYSQRYLEVALTGNPEIAASLVELFETRFDPDRFVGQDEARNVAEEAVTRRVVEQLADVPSLDHDTIVRSFLSVIRATTRTNFYQSAWRVDSAAAPMPIALKLDPREVPHLPAPRPMYEVWVYSPAVEGVHLRFGKIARGGLRWSDRQEDFRTEVLGLVKAQMVKNAVIVPTGAKGGFYPKRLPDPQHRREWLDRGADAYRMFVGALLSVTDNLVGGVVVPPARVVRRDGDDTYLVVAADKGTAAFSDLANSVAEERGFWLGDAFASGGSTGYDHKAMGITARGAWESVRRHFLGLGVDPAKDEVTVVGIGDMSGDVFGNGMLLSRHLRLVAAFDHRHIFVDPDPDPEVGFAERKRLFDLPGSSWADYAPELLGEGGGVFPRTAKSIPVSERMRAVFPLGDATRVTPDELIRAVLCADVDLLWNGGIGTYVKASDEQHADIGDRANDGVRVDGRQLRCRVVGEGGNLGVSQRGRIEAALHGVRVNTDAIDNSGGVDSSDHEVNLKILLAHALRGGEMTWRQRNEVLRSMSDDVAARVLRTNYEQNVLLSNARHLGDGMLGAHDRLMEWLEDRGMLDRALEALPDHAALQQRAKDGVGLTSPEFSVLVAYAKMALKDALLESTLPDDPWFEATLGEYFPPRVRGDDAAMAAHPLRREIIATQVANSLVNRGGITFAHRAMEETGASVPEIAKAFVVCREAFDMAGFVREVEALDGRASAAVQSELYIEFRRLLDQAVRTLLARRTGLAGVQDEIDRYRSAADALRSELAVDLKTGRSRFAERLGSLIAMGVPDGLASTAAGLLDLVAVFNVVDLSSLLEEDLPCLIEAHFRVAEILRVDAVSGMLAVLPHEARWDALARSSLREDLRLVVRSVTADALRSSDRSLPAAERVAAWAHRQDAALTVIRDALAEFEAGEQPALGPLWVIVRDLQRLVPAT